MATHTWNVVSAMGPLPNIGPDAPWIQGLTRSFAGDTGRRVFIILTRSRTPDAAGSYLYRFYRMNEDGSGWNQASNAFFSAGVLVMASSEVVDEVILIDTIGDFIFSYRWRQSDLRYVSQDDADPATISLTTATRGSDGAIYSHDRGTNRIRRHDSTGAVTALGTVSPTAQLGAITDWSASKLLGIRDIGAGATVFVPKPTTTGQALDHEAPVPYRGSLSEAQQQRFDEVITGDGTNLWIISPTERTLSKLNLVPNRKPNPPVLTFPASGQSVSRAQELRFRWWFTDPDHSDRQTAYEIRWREAGTTTWTGTATAVTADEYSLPLSSFSLAAGSWEWSARTRDANNEWGDWSAPVGFTVTNATNAPIISAPTPGATITSRTTTLVWAAAAAATRHEVRTVASSGGNPVTASIYYSSGALPGAGGTHPVPFDTSPRAEHIQVREEVNGVWGDWATVGVNVAWNKPMNPKIFVEPDKPKGAITVYAINPTPTGTRPAPTRNLVQRRQVAGASASSNEVFTIGTAPVNGAWVDHWVGDEEDVEYQLLAETADGLTARSGWPGETAQEDTGEVISDTSAGAVTFGPNRVVNYGEPFELKLSLIQAGTGTGGPPYADEIEHIAGSADFTMTGTGDTRVVTIFPPGGVTSAPRDKTLTGVEGGIRISASAPTYTPDGIRGYEAEIEDVI